MMPTLYLLCGLPGAGKTTRATEARELGARCEVVFVDAPLATLHERVAQRNVHLPPGTFHIAPEELDEWAALFEPPTAEELAGE